MCWILHGSWRPVKFALYLVGTCKGVLNRVVRLYLSVNGYFLCTAVHYVFTDGTFYTEPDPKYIRIDDLEWKQ